MTNDEIAAHLAAQREHVAQQKRTEADIVQNIEFLQKRLKDVRFYLKQNEEHIKTMERLTRERDELDARRH